jgi:hypothetical protein
MGDFTLFGAIANIIIIVVIQVIVNGIIWTIIGRNPIPSIMIQ